MTKDEAIEAIREYQKMVTLTAVALSMASISFGLHGPEIEEALEVDLFKQLDAKELTQAFSNYLTVLQNAIDGKLAPAVEQEWGDILE